MWDISANLLEARLTPSTEESSLDHFEESVLEVESEVSGSVDSGQGERSLERGDPVRRFENQPSRLVDFVDVTRPSDTPTSYFLHLVLPHQPWRYDVDGSEYLLPGGKTGPGREGPDGEWLANTVRPRHSLQATYADALLGEILDATKAADIYDDSLAIVMADHGVAFEPGLQRRELLPETRAGVAYAPLLIKAPGQSLGSVSDLNARTVNVLPTIAGELGVTIP